MLYFSRLLKHFKYSNIYHVFMKCLFDYGRRGIALTRDCTHFLKLDSRSPGAGLTLLYSPRRKRKKKEKLLTKISFVNTKRLNTFINKWMQSRVGAIPHLPFDYNLSSINCKIFSCLKYLFANVLFAILLDYAVLYLIKFFFIIILTPST